MKVKKKAVPEVYEVTQPLVSIGIRITGPYWHIESALTNKGAGVGRHVG